MKSKVVVEAPPSTGLAKKILLLAAKAFIILGGAIPYIPQYFQILQTRNTNGFSLGVCFCFIMSNALRIAYFYQVRYDLALFAQSIVMIFVMFIMLELVLRIQRSSPRLRAEHNFLDWDFSHFWRWTNLLSYIQCTFFILSISGFLVGLFAFVPGVVAGVGWTSVIFDALIATPQIAQNIKRKSTEGMNVSMVVMWCLGDLYKEVYYYMEKVPLQFQICVCVQFTLDLVLMAQIFYYGKGPPPPDHTDE